MCSFRPFFCLDSFPTQSPLWSALPLLALPSLARRRLSWHFSVEKYISGAKRGSKRQESGAKVQNLHVSIVLFVKILQERHPKRWFYAPKAHRRASKWFQMEQKRWQYKGKREKRMTNDEWWMMNDEWRMTNDEWWMMNDEWWMMNDEWRMMNI